MSSNSSFKSTQLVSTKTRLRVSSSAQTLMSLYFGPKVPLDFVLQIQTPEMIKEEEERREKVKQAKKEEQSRLEQAKREKEMREKKTEGLRKFNTGYKWAPRNYG